jgi:hypothetical protein
MRRLLAPLVILFGLAFVTWAYFAPHLTVRSMRLAAEAGDADGLSRHIDYPALRESAKQELAQELGGRLGSLVGGRDLGALGAVGAQIVGALGNNALDQAVDALVRPETLSAMFAGRDLANEYSLLPSGDSGASEAPVADAQKPPQFDTSDFRATMGYDTFGRFAVNVQEPQSGRRVKLILTRDKLLWWKLSAVDLAPVP